MKLIKRHKAIFCAIGACVLVWVLILTIERKDTILDCFNKNPDKFNAVANDLCSNLSDAFPILLNRGSNIQETADYPISLAIVEAIEYIFSTSDCDRIFASKTLQGTPFCQFSIHGHDSVKGIAFVGNHQNSKSVGSIFLGLSVKECTFITDEWVYFEYLTAEGEKNAFG